MRRFTAALLASSLLLAGGCASPTHHDALTVGTTGAPATLDFTTTSGAAIPQALMGNVYETLVRTNDDGSISPWLATSWEATPTSYTFHLRDGVRFTDGSPFDAHSAKYSIDNVATWTNGLKAGMAPVANTTVLDRLTLRVDLKAPSQNWLWVMGTFVGSMMTPTATPADPVGTGPYLIKEWKERESLSFTANPDYWGEAPHSPTAQIRYYPDAVSSTNALAAGDVDIVWKMDAPELLDRLQKFDIHVGTTNGEVLLSMNNNAAPFNDIAVRRAVFLGVDRQGVIDSVFEGMGTDTGGTPVPPTDPWFSPSTGVQYNPAAAREILQQAGYATDGSDPRLHVTITSPSLPYAQAVSEVVYSQLRDLGFTMTLRTAEFPAVWLSQVMKQKDYQMSVIAHVEPRDIGHIFGNPNYYIGFDSPRTRELLAAADAAASAEQSTELMRQAVAEIMDQAASLTVLNFPNIVVTRPGVQGFNATAVTDTLPLGEVILP